MAVSVRTLASILAVALAAPAVSGAEAEPSALERGAESVAESVRASAGPGWRSVALCVRAGQAPALARAAETALAAALGRRGLAVQVLAGDDCGAAEHRARGAGVDALVRLEVRLEAGQLVAVGDWLPTWVNFWAGRDPVRGAGGAPLAVRLPADPGSLAFAGASADPAAPRAEARYRVRALGELEGRVVALALGDLDGLPGDEIAALAEPEDAFGQANERRVKVLRADGTLLAHGSLSGLPPSPRPPREPAGTLAIVAPAAAGGRPRLAAFAFDRARGALFELDGASLALVGTSEEAALGRGLRGRPLAGTNLLAAEIVLPAGTPASVPFAPLALLRNPSAAGPAWLAVGSGGQGAVLGEELTAVEAVLPSLGAGSTLADLDGDGAAELVASLPVRAEDRLRVLRLGAAGTSAVHESEPVQGQVAAAASGDLAGDGRFQAVFASWLDGGATALLVLEAER